MKDKNAYKASILAQRLQDEEYFIPSFCEYIDILVQALSTLSIENVAKGTWRDV